MISSIALAHAIIKDDYSEAKLRNDPTVLISERRQAVPAVMKEITKPVDGEVVVDAYVENEDGEMRMNVNCTTIKDTITCEW